jgi:hypothetical protein
MIGAPFEGINMVEQYSRFFTLIPNQNKCKFYAPKGFTIIIIIYFDMIHDM